MEKIINKIVYMTVYHTTDKVYQKGQVVSVSDFKGGLSLYHVNAGNNKCVNDYLDKDRPCKFPERKRAIYTFGSIEHCLAFDKKKEYIYKVDIPKTNGHPMCLTEVFTSDSQEPDNIKRQIRSEYWTPEREWKFYEYLSTSMTIIEECNGMFLKEVAGLMDRDKDYNLRKYFIIDLKRAQFKLCQSSSPLYLTSLDDTI